MPTIQIKEAKLISNKYEKLLWSVSQEESSKIQASGGSVKITENENFGRSFCVSTKIMEDSQCETYNSMRRDQLIVGNIYWIYIDFRDYVYKGVSGISMTSLVRTLVGRSTPPVNQRLLSIMTAPAVV